MKRETYIFGVILFIAAVIIFTSLIYQIIGWWALVVGPIVALGACRPAKDGSPWIWERDVVK